MCAVSYQTVSATECNTYCENPCSLIEGAGCDALVGISTELTTLCESECGSGSGSGSDGDDDTENLAIFANGADQVTTGVTLVGACVAWFM